MSTCLRANAIIRLPGRENPEGLDGTQTDTSRIEIVAGSARPIGARLRSHVWLRGGKWNRRQFCFANARGKRMSAGADSTGASLDRFDNPPLPGESKEIPTGPRESGRWVPAAGPIRAGLT